MERQANLSKFGGGVAAALIVVVPVLLAGCARERPAYVIQPDRAETPAGYEGQGRYLTVVVRRDESVSEIAERCDVSVATVERLNDLDNDRPIYPGQVLRVPSLPHVERVCERREAYTARAYEYPPRPLPRPHREIQARYEPDAVPRPRPDRDDADAYRNTATSGGDSQSWWSWWSKPSDKAPADSGTARFIWPVRGRVIEAFGRGSYGERNDGINIATEEGAPIRAAGAGTVTYAGNELKGYGNLILIKHRNGYVTAYAHARSVRVTRGEIVDRGQIIGTAGATGDVDRPQLHFEVRRGVQPVDPTRFLAADRAS